MENEIEARSLVGYQGFRVQMVASTNGKEYGN